MKKKFKPRLEQMFPNCAKYDICCTRDEEFWKKVGKGIPVIPSKEIPIIETSHTMILHNVNGFKINKKRDKIPDMPEGFEGA
ncbi:hypothetical protein LCGC14_0586230 [marine sediment metagenome]|uniref:Uncharacterized protein n=1 Tax=marine sediment metagenome TaxID=412755 RepID=A0A0F9RYL6_9ZZZZ